MSKLDKQKEKINFLRTMFFFLLASMFGLVAFIFTKYFKLSETQLFLINFSLLSSMEKSRSDKNFTIFSAFLDCSTTLK